jgi:hypothetical protein
VTGKGFGGHAEQHAGLLDKLKKIYNASQEEMQFAASAGKSLPLYRTKSQKRGDEYGKS